MAEHASENSSRQRNAKRNSVGNTLLVAISLSLVCSILVAGAAVVLRPVQQANEDRFRQRIVLEVAGLMQPGADVELLFAGIEARMVELASGRYVDTPEPADFDPLIAAGDPDLGITIPPDLDLAGIRRRARYAPVYLVRDNSQIEQIIIPVYGKGLWSTMYGYLALASDGVTVKGLRFYNHAETPGLGDQIDKPDWRQQWVGKQVTDATGKPRIEVVRGVVPANSGPDTHYQIDGLSGATLTGRGVTHLIRYWTGPHGFGPYLQNVRQTEGDAK